MQIWSITVDAVNNSISGGQPCVVEFGGSLAYGDVLTVEAQATDTWSFNAGATPTNADGAMVTFGPDNREVTIDWSQFSPVSPVNPPAGSNASAYRFGVGCLVGSMDGGNSFFAVGTRFSTTYMGGTSPTAPSSLALYYWDGYTPDNDGTITLTVQLTSPTAS